MKFKNCFLCFLITLTFFTIGIIKVKAEVDDNTLLYFYCDYKQDDINRYLLIKCQTKNSICFIDTKDVGENDATHDFTYFYNNANDLFKAGNSASISDKNTITWLKKNGFIDNNIFTCPTNPFNLNAGSLVISEVSSNALNKTNNVTIKDVTGYEYTSTDDSFKCKYTNKKTSKSLVIEYNDNTTLYTITFPDKTTKEIKAKDAPSSGYFLPTTKECDDIYYINSNKNIQVGLGLDGKNNVALGKLCKNYEDSEIEHFCSGNCNYKNYSCNDLVSISTGDPIVSPTYDTDKLDLCNDPDFLRILMLTKKVVSIITLCTALVLIIFGIINIAKTITDEKADLSKSIKKFKNQLILAAIIFLAPALINWIFFTDNFITSKSDMLSECVNNLSEKKIKELDKQNKNKQNNSSNSQNENSHTSNSQNSHSGSGQRR